MPIFVEEDLQKMTIEMLREICQKYNIRQGNNNTKFF